MTMKNPVHPGQIIGNDCLKALGLTITSGAKVLGVSRVALSKLIRRHASVSPEMAIRLSKAFGSMPEFWLRVQMNYDLAQIQVKADDIKIERYQPKDQPNNADMQEASTTPAHVH